MSRIVTERKDTWVETGEVDEFGYPYEVRHTEYAVLECDCGEMITLYSDPMVCENCGQYYSVFGQPLAHPSQWERDDYLDEDLPGTEPFQFY